MRLHKLLVARRGFFLPKEIDSTIVDALQEPALCLTKEQLHIISLCKEEKLLVHKGEKTVIKKIKLALMGVMAAMFLAGCANMEKPIILDSDVAFAFGSADLTPAGKSKINQYAASLMARGEIRIEIIGHSDRIGDARSNQVLSERRAQAVRNQLLTHRLDPDHIKARGLGSRDPIVTNCNQSNNTALIACLAPNRRVEINVTDLRW